MGRRTERGINTCRFARTLSGADATTDDLDLLLDLVDSQITYRARYLTGLALTPVRDLVMLDPFNTRSVAFQVFALRDRGDTTSNGRLRFASDTMQRAMSMRGEFSRKLRSTPTAWEILRTVKLDRRPSLRLVMTTPSNAWIRSLFPSMTLTNTFTVSPARKSGISSRSCSSSILRINSCDMTRSSRRRL